MVLLPLPGRSPSPSPKSWSSGPTPSPPRARSRPRAPRSFSRPPRRLFPERPASSIARILSSARCMASRARSVCPPSSASMPSLASELQLPPLRPRRSISSSSSRSFWGEISGERPLMSDLDLRNTILYCVVVKSDWRSGNRSTCSSNRSRSSPFFRKLLKSGRWFDSAVSLKIAERSPAVDPPPVPVRCAKSRSSNDGRLRGSLGSGRDRSAVISVLARSSCCSCSAVGVVGPLERGGDAVGQAEGTVGQPRRVSGGHAPGEPVRGAGERAQEHERGSEDERGEAEDGFEGEHGRGEESTPECAAQAPVLGAAHSDLPRDPPDKDFDRLRMGHGSPPVLSGERLLYRWL